MTARTVRWLPGGLRWRLGAWVAAVLLLSFGVMFAVVYRDTGSQLRAQIDRDLRNESSQLAQALNLLAGRPPGEIATAARRYVAAQPYRSTSTLLFAQVPGNPTASNHPELFSSAPPDSGETAADQTAENRLVRPVLAARGGFSTRTLPDVGSMRVLTRVLHLGTVRVVAGAAEPLTAVRRAQHGVARAFLLAGALTLVLALATSWLAGARISAPLRGMARTAARVDAGDLEPRIVPPPGRSDEVRVLADAFNHMLDRLAGAFAAQRAFVADASHELRTPLTVIRGQLEVLAAQPDPAPAEIRRVQRLVESELGRITRIIDDLLLLAQSDRSDFLRPTTIDVAEFMDDLWDGALVTAERRFELGPVAAGTLRADPDRLAQALRNLLRNAVEHTDQESGHVRLETLPTAGGHLRFIVADDGPGIPESDWERVFERFHRTDPARSRKTGGAGLGLAIVRAIAEAHGGTVRVAPSGQGARLELELPGFRAATTPAAETSAVELAHGGLREPTS